LLYDLIHCFHDDLPHVVYISWKDYHGINLKWYWDRDGNRCHDGKGVYWEDFVDEIIKKGLTVGFDHEIEPASMNRHTFIISLKFWNRPSGTMVRRFCSVSDVRPLDKDNQCRYILRFDNKWIEEEIDTSNSEFFDGIDVDITLRSSLIHDKNGKALDGDFIASRLPTGNGVQGGDFVSWFSVMPKKEKKKDKLTDKQKEIYPVD
jgi:hypothetical protein